jgi:hypothetical protein
VQWIFNAFKWSIFKLTLCNLNFPFAALYLCALNLMCFRNDDTKNRPQYYTDGGFEASIPAYIRRD